MNKLATEGLNVLEIGYGSHPAVKEGEIFKDPSVFYVGLELPRSFEGSFMDMRSQVRSDFPEVTGASLALPFRDESFDIVLMRSVYGQFRSRPEIVTAVRLGMLEMARVAKFGGKVVIAEENTPRDPEYIEIELKSAGLKVEQFVERQDYKRDPDPEQQTAYYDLRKAFYNYKWHDLDSFMTIACKPDDWSGEPFVLDEIANFYDTRNSRDDWDVRTFSFLKPKKLYA